MTKKVQVTKAQARAAQVIVERGATTGRYVRSGVSKIASASSGTSQSETPGRIMNTPKSNGTSTGSPVLKQRSGKG
ncbi:MAG: hypothetical protein M3Y42_15230 [Actinomycetota bacterium]|nr:hypothetical protein [Actinomycetota bacterium]MDQ2958305.1 hypothetical protein [Actinomycetota bacterium]